MAIKQRKAFIISIVILILTSLLLPDLSFLHMGNIYKFSYGVPFKFITIRTDYFSYLFLPKLFIGHNGLHINLLALLINIAIFYLISYKIINRHN